MWWSRWWRKVAIHPAWWLLALAYAAVGQWQMMLLGFIVIGLHELSHVVMAEVYGLTVERIELWPLGGMARISGLGAQDADVEAMVALAGPLNNFLLAAVGWLLAPWLPVDAYWMSWFITFNLGLGALNLIPVAPLDGGHLAELVMAQRVGRQRAERWVRQWGRALAVAAMTAGLIQLGLGGASLSLLLFGGFLFWGAHRPREAAYWMMRDVAIRNEQFQRHPIWPLDDFAVRSTTPVGQVIRSMRPLHYHRVQVLDPELRCLGTLYEEQLLEALAEHGFEVPVGHLLKPR